jgi:hypothetical protein
VGAAQSNKTKQGSFASSSRLCCHSHRQALGAAVLIFSRRPLPVVTPIMTSFFLTMPLKQAHPLRGDPSPALVGGRITGQA